MWMFRLKESLKEDEMNELHGCEIEEYPEDWGPAITYCGEDDKGYLFVSNSEYASAVNYCPECGYKAKLTAQSYTILAKEKYRLEKEEEARKASERYQKAKARKLERRNKDKA